MTSVHFSRLTNMDISTSNKACIHFKNLSLEHNKLCVRSPSEQINVSAWI